MDFASFVLNILHIPFQKKKAFGNRCQTKNIKILSHVIFRDLIKMFIFTIRRPPAKRSLIIMLLLIRSGPEFHRNLKKKSVSNRYLVSPGGFGKAKNRWMNLLKANDLITVILPNSVNLRLDHCFIKLSTLFIIVGAFTSQISNTSVVNVIPKIQKCPFVQSRL